MSFRSMSALWMMFVFATSPILAQQERGKPKDLPEPNRTVEFKKVGDKSLKLHLFDIKKSQDRRIEPADAKPAAIVFFFGGGWTSGTPSQFYPQAKHLSELGMLAICAEYRVRSRDEALVVDCVADAQDAVAYIRQHADELGIDGRRIVAAGGSAGGHLAATCATLPYRGTNSKNAEACRPNALVLFNPVLIVGITEEKASAQEQARLDALKARLGDEPDKLSPIEHLTQNLPPTLILHGKADTTVPYKTVELFTNQAKKLGCDCTLIGYDGQQHGFFNYQRNQTNYEATRDEMVRFLTRIKYVPGQKP